MVLMEGEDTAGKFTSPIEKRRGRGRECHPLRCEGARRQAETRPATLRGTGEEGTTVGERKFSA